MARPLDVVIVGGGIGGLSAAIAIRLAGHNVVVHEAAEKIEEIGAGLQFSANATRILTRWGLDKSILGDVVEPHNCIMKRWQDGSTVASLALHDYHRQAYGSPFWDIHRHDLIVALHRRAVDLGAQIKTDSKVVDVDFDAGSVTLKSGETYTADLVVGADGLNSLCRQRFVPTEQPEFTGDMAFRVLLNVEDLPPDDLEFRELAANPQCTYWLGPNGHAIVYVLKGGRQINLVAVAPDDLPAGVIRAPCQVEDVLKIFKDWDPLLQKIISQEKVIWKWKLHKRPALDKWCHPSGKFTLLGDAVHPTLPYLSQGAGISLEDAAVLGHILAQRIPLSEAIVQYEALRRPRTTKIVQAATQQQYWYHLADGEVQKKRDEIMGAEKSCEGDPFLWREPTFAPWLYGYDAYEEAERAIADGLSLGFANGTAN
ncbi:hypothetical protein LTR10_022035 [Elasticomyces elasticus]|uniref:FAD-binding domain-containing protein n=1 Tax=Exophiala sideris TaxID=1016849 RepID=A0ABR0JLL4_9EURO|nr:hypothetical protein LTR10_022035 [Elasticomyces elasticus]KAK5036470.1 hypothetical protein LTS07_002197 [Exophiala sideris]KAK5041701.1 hypothetical protein LTR13_002368 [Exophiala sideris]KAK5066853.1 hypothetical protein LTR69_002201 [Exophiala sideris]KAK5184912.1 hypothetical protein LTR44_002758 [Eurotiomycetes sp. CCFEE 6388]